MSEHTDLPPVLEAFGEELARTATALARHPESPRRRNRTLLGAALTTICVTVVVLVALISGGGAGAPTSASAHPLELAAEAALRQPSLFPGDDQYFYVRTEGTEPTGASTKTGGSINAVETIITDRWQSANRKSLQRTRILALHFRSRVDAAYWRANLGPRNQVGSKTSDFLGVYGGYGIDVGPGNSDLTRRQVFALPSNPHALYALLIPKNRLRHPTPALRMQIAQWKSQYGSLNNYLAYYAFNAIVSSFQQSPMPPALRSGMYGMLALIPGVKDVGYDRDLVGRRGAAVEFTDRYRHIRTELIFDPNTSALLGIRQTAVGKATGFRKGSTFENLAFLNEAVTNTLTIPHAARIH